MTIFWPEMGLCRSSFFEGYYRERYEKFWEVESLLSHISSEVLINIWSFGTAFTDGAVLTHSHSVWYTPRKIRCTKKDSKCKMQWENYGVHHNSLQSGCTRGLSDWHWHRAHLWGAKATEMAWTNKELSKITWLALLTMGHFRRSTPSAGLEAIANVAPLHLHIKYRVWFDR